MGAWIEIRNFNKIPAVSSCRTPRWVRGLKFVNPNRFSSLFKSRTPRWVRGLKFLNAEEQVDYLTVAPHDGCVD